MGCTSKLAADADKRAQTYQLKPEHPRIKEQSSRLEMMTLFILNVVGQHGPSVVLTELHHLMEDLTEATQYVLAGAEVPPHLEAIGNAVVRSIKS